MEITHQSNTLTSELENLLLSAFSTISLSDFVKSTRLVDGLRGFLERGTPTDCWKLVPIAHKDIILNIQSKATRATLNNSSTLLGTTSTEDISATISPLASPPVSAATIQHSPHRKSQSAKEWHFLSPGCMAQSQPNADKPLSTPSVSLAEHLATQTKCDDRDRIWRLVRAIEAIKSAAQLPSRSYETLWSAREGLFDGTETGHRGWMCRLDRGRKRIKESRETIECASRLSLMLAPQFVDYMEKWMGLPLKSGKPGVTRRTLACEAVARDWGIELKKLIADIHRSGTYFYLLEKAGPGIHLELGSKVTSLWEKSLTQPDVDAILAYIKDKLPKLETRHKKLNGIAARAIHAGLVACGWDSEALSRSTRLTDSIDLYKDEPNPPETLISDDNNQPWQKRGRNNDNNHLPTKRRKKHSHQTTKSKTSQGRKSIENHTRPQAGLITTQSANQEVDSPTSDISMQALVTVEQHLQGQENESDTAQYREVCTGTEASPTNENLQRLDSHLGGAPILSGCADVEDHGLYDSGLHFNAGSSEHRETLNAGNNLSPFDDPPNPNYDPANDLVNFMYDPSLDLVNFAYDPSLDLANFSL